MAKSSTRRVTIYINGKEEDASGWQTFSYGKLGEVTENIRTFALPFEPKPYTFRMKYKYDSFNRMQQMTYPDGEKVSYGYNLGGMLNDIKGDKNGQTYPYVNHIAYNQYELKDTVWYGNGTLATYEYDMLMRLKRLQSYTGTSPAELMQDIYYDYDAVSNITHIDNQAPMLGVGLGGTYESSYTYDNLYRLSSAGGSWDNGAMANTFELNMSYYPNGRINRKQLRADVLDHLGNITTKDYENLYSYPDGRNTLEQTVDQNGQFRQNFGWDHAGNMTSQRFHDECTRRLCWDEENRLAGVADCNYASLYLYDANGDRTYKLTGQYSYQNINGRYYPYAVLDNPTLYASPYVVCTPKGYTKHYYAESERVASKIGNGCLRDLCKSLNTDADFNKEDEPENPYLKDCDEENELLFEKQERNCIYSKNVMACLESENFIAEKTLEGLYSRIECVEEGEDECYWYHPDHLGSSSWITFSDGSAVQHLHYLPWGEDFVDQRSTSWNAMHTFSSKERDAETGLSYFGARYYSSDLSIWLSVDPMADKYPSLSPYVYCANNPVKLVDPNGEEINPIFSTSGELLGTDSKGWKGKAIVMDKKDFKKGMKHEDALKKGTELDKYGKGIKISDKDWKTVEEKGGERMSPYVENHSGETIYFKPETTYGEYNNEGAYPLEAGKDLYMPVDGVATSKYNDNVGKIPTGATVKITKEGGLNIDFHGFGGLIRLHPDYGWVNKKWQRKQQKAGDSSWDKLFKMAGQIGRRPY